MLQEKFKSPILKAGLISLLIFLVRKYSNYEMQTELADVIVDVVLSGILTLSIWHNPNGSDKP